MGRTLDFGRVPLQTVKQFNWGSHRNMTRKLLLACAFGLALAPVPAVSQAAASDQTASTAKGWQPPKTPWGDPDLEGIWPGNMSAPLQRPKNMGDRTALSDQEFAQRESQAKRAAAADAEEFAPKDQRVGIGPPSYWTERGKPTRQASLIIDPPDGQLPPMTPEGKAMQARTPAEWGGVSNSYEDVNLYYRCITRGVVGSLIPVVYNNGNQIVQSPGYVVIRNEMIHETRVIPLDGRPHVSPGIQMYMGDSRGHWQGNTLVIDTTNFNGKTSIGSNGVAYNGQGGRTSDALHLIERLTRVDANTLNYQVTIDDPKTWTRPWTLLIPLQLDDRYQFLEYACHEGNYALKDILSGARAQEAAGRGSK